MTTKKLFLRFVSISLVFSILLVSTGCGKQIQTQETKPQQTGQPVKGGTLRIINTTGPQVLGYPPDQGPADSSAGFPAVERIMDLTADRNIKPFLAQSVVMDPDKLTMTINLREGILFTDGSELTAEVAAWNYKLMKETGKLPNAKIVASIEVKDKYTLVLQLTKWYDKTMMEMDLGWVAMVSKEAVEKNGKEWARTNVVGTGPFKLENFMRDVSISWVRNDNYWQKDKGLPYLDRIEVKYIPDPTTAGAMMQAKEADIWQNASVKDQAEAQKNGLIRQSSWPGLEYNLIPNTTDLNSKWNDKRLRLALDYALDKPTIAKALGFGLYVPLDQVAPPGEWGINPNYSGIRKYDPAKAKQLLAEAGYSNGLKIKLLAPILAGGRNEAAEAIKGYLDAVGFETSIDTADPGRYSASIYKNGWEDLAFAFSSLGLNYMTAATIWWSDTPKTNLVGFKRPQALIDLFHQALIQKGEAEQKAYTEKIVNLMTDEALVIPIYHVPSAIITAPSVNTSYPKEGLSRWDFANSWIEKK